MNGAMKHTHIDAAPEIIAKMMAMIEASKTDSCEAEVAKHIYLDELREELALRLEALGGDDAALAKTGQWIN